MVDGRNRSRSIVKISLFSLIVLGVCLIVCLIHIGDIKTNFEQKMSSNLRSDLQIATQVVSDRMKHSMTALKDSADKISNSVHIPTKPYIINVISESQKIDAFEAVVYISRNGTIFYSDGMTQDSTEAGIFRYVDVETPVVKIMNPHETVIQKGLAYYIVPVYYKSEKIGQIVGIKYLTGLLKEDSFQYINQIGDTFMMNQNGDIQAENVDDFKLDLYESESIFDRIAAITGNTEQNRAKIEGWKTSLSKDDYIYDELVNPQGEKVDVAIMRIAASDNLFLVHCFPDSVFSDAVRPILIRTVFVCGIIVVLMLSLILFVWASTKHHSKMIEILAYKDNVTNGKNANYFYDQAIIILSNNKERAYLVERFDVLNFRYINEAYGHLRSDDLLKIIYHVASEIFQEDELCVRLDSDQYVLLAKNDDHYFSRIKAIEQQVNEEVKKIGIYYPIRLKRGIYQIRNGEHEIQTFIDRANIARKSVDRRGKELVAIYSDKIINEMRKIDKIEAEMEDALVNGGFRIYIQPKWDVVKDQICGGEALVRWIKSDGSIISPNSFIPIFERNGFIEKLDFYMLESICKKMRELIDMEVEILPISINQSRILLHNPEYVNRVESIIEAYHVPKEMIELELTETVFFSEKNKMLHVMRQLKEQNVVISMDDFGSGYSSLNLLKEIPFDVLKIDREFFGESVSKKSSSFILKKIVEMAEGLGIQVVCEGVETKEQLDIITEIGCRYVQGFYYGKPMPMDVFIEKYHNIKPV